MRTAQQPKDGKFRVQEQELLIVQKWPFPSLYLDEMILYAVMDPTWGIE